jgi:hypothetical protein
MKLKLSWPVTGDFLFFDIINKDVTCWFVEQSQTLGTNQFSKGDQVIDILSAKGNTQSLIEEEKNYIAKVNEILTRLKLPLFREPDNYYEIGRASCRERV